MDYLAKKNPHIRDDDITFDEEPHIYTIKGDSSFTSVTTWNHSHFEEFDADVIIDRMMKSKKWPESKYFGKTKKEIKEEWDKNRDEASAAGTKMHYDIECFYNNSPNKNDSIEYGYFGRFLEKFGNLQPYRTEWMIYHEELKLAGSIDMVYENNDGSLQIYDWKRCKQIVKHSVWNKYSHRECISHLPDTNYWHYCLQLNTYKAILEAKYDKRVTDMYLVCMHPNNKSFQRIKVANLEDEIKDLFLERNREIIYSKGKT